MKKYLIIIIVLLLTGCSVEYNLNISNNAINEEVKIYMPDSTDTTINDIVFMYGDPTTGFGDYTFSALKSPSKGIDINRNEPFKALGNSMFLSYCYDSYDYIDINNRTWLKTIGDNLCFEESEDLEKITVNVTVYGNVVEHNADRVNNNVYTWDITRENKGRQLSIETNSLITEEQYQQKEEQESGNYIDEEEIKKEEEQKKILNLTLIIILTIVVLVLGISTYFGYKNNKVNKI